MLLTCSYTAAYSIAYQYWNLCCRIGFQSDQHFEWAHYWVAHMPVLAWKRLLCKRKGWEGAEDSSRHDLNWLKLPWNCTLIFGKKLSSFKKKKIDPKLPPPEKIIIRLHYSIPAVAWKKTKQKNYKTTNRQIISLVKS